MFQQRFLSVCLLALGLVGSFSSQTFAAEVLPASPDRIWQRLAGLPPRAGAPMPWIEPDKFSAVSLDIATLERAISEAPKEFTAAALQAPKVLTIPMPDGTYARFRIVDSPIMEPGLAVKFPEIRTFSGQGIDDPAATVRFDWTPAGFHAQILSPSGTVYVDPYWRDNRTFYMSYYKRDYRRRTGFECLTPAAEIRIDPPAPAAAMSGETLQTYRLAVAATSEYTAFHGGTIIAGMAAIVTAMNRVNGVYESEVAVRMVLIANNDSIVYTNGGTDPYTNGDGFAMLDENQANLDAVIGNSNYDVGHVFSTGGGGVAGLSVICESGFKAWGVTGLPAPTGDAFYIDYVAHEMGHQFGGNHTFNSVTSNCGGGNRNGSTAFEPGSASTIQGYAGICGADDLQPNSDAYFHSISFDEIRAHITGSGGTCDVATSTGNSAPTVDAGSNHTIPARTPFALTASGSDIDGDTLTYCWEERDLGPPTTLAAADNGSSPLFRSWIGTLDPTRTFPRLSNLLNNTLPIGEKLPTTNRTMNFRVLARDNRAGGGGVGFDSMQVTISNSSGPFMVTAPNTAITWDGVQTVTWNVANTTAPPVNSANVDILLSTDGGNTFPIVLASGTPNDGSESITLPDIDTLTARIKVQGSNNIFFDISNINFKIGSCPLLATPASENPAYAKTRALSFTPGNPGFTNAGIRIILTNLPAGFDAAEGDAMWVGPPRAISESASSTAGTPLPSFQGANLQCTAHCRDWSTVGLLHVFDQEIIPGAQYTVQMVDCGCGFSNETDFSLPLEMTTPRYGDVTGVFNAGLWTAPNGAVDFLDIGAMVDKFRGVPDSVIKVRADLAPDTPDSRIDFLDIGDCVDAFRGLSYARTAPIGCP